MDIASLRTARESLKRRMSKCPLPGATDAMWDAVERRAIDAHRKYQELEPVFAVMDELRVHDHGLRATMNVQIEIRTDIVTIANRIRDLETAVERVIECLAQEVELLKKERVFDYGSRVPTRISVIGGQ
ncbi:MAG: hypothetical protein KAY24_00370 [Candidatus Eisenbacteria sp.]|nr:hypothetical protein [Candidatus Eisenbacteria bacterium]